ncbi:MAG: carbohydrate ABC transporter permease [Actinomycetota bacterium]
MNTRSWLSRIGIHGTLLVLVVWSVLPFLWTFQTSIKFTRDVASKEPVLWGYETTSNAYNAFWLDDDEINMFHVLWFIAAFAIVAALIGFAGRLIAQGPGEKTGRTVAIATGVVAILGLWLAVPRLIDDELTGGNTLSLLLFLGMVALGLGLIVTIIRRGERDQIARLLGSAIIAIVIVALARVLQIYISEREQWSLWEDSENGLWTAIGVALTILAFIIAPIALAVAMWRARERGWPYFTAVGLVLGMGFWWFPRVFEVNDEFDFFINSIIVTVLTMIISISIGLLAGYGLARYTGISGAVILIIALGFRALPRTAFVLPYFFGAQRLGILDSRLVIVMALVAINQPFTIWMFRTFFMDVPKEMEEAAMMDGATRLQAFRKVIIPIMWPGIIATSLFTMLLAYNEFLFVRVLAPTNWTLPVAIVSLTGGESSRTITEAAAASVSITLPIVIVIILFQRHLVKGLGAGAVKG